MSNSKTPYKALIINVIGLISIISLISSPTNLIGKPLLQYQNPFNQEALESIAAQQQKQKRSIFSYRVQNNHPEHLKTLLETLYPTYKIAINERHRQLLIEAPSSSHKTLQHLLIKNDTPLPQIKLEVKIIEITSSNKLLLEHPFSKLNSQIKFHYNNTQHKFLPLTPIESILQYLTEMGHAKILASPTITTLDNHPAEIKIGDRLPYINQITDGPLQTQSIQQIDTGIRLQLIPKIVSINHIETTLTMDISTVKLWKKIGTIEHPLLSSRVITTRVIIPNNQTLVMAGLYQENTKLNISSIPFLHRLPLLGGLFTSTSKERIQSDIILMITPSIL